MGWKPLARSTTLAAAPASRTEANHHRMTPMPCRAIASLSRGWDGRLHHQAGAHEELIAALERTPSFVPDKDKPKP